MSTNFGPDAPLRRNGIEQLFGDFAHGQDQVLEACLYAAAEEAEAAAADVFAKIRDRDTSHIAARIDDGDVSFTLHFDENLSDRKAVLFGASWTRAQEGRDKPYVFVISVQPDAEFPEDLDLQMRLKTAERSYDVCPYGALIREVGELEEILDDEPSRPWQPLSSHGLRLIVGAATEIMARTAALAHLIRES